jgi:hypothetical protein
MVHGDDEILVKNIVSCVVNLGETLPAFGYALVHGISNFSNHSGISFFNIVNFNVQKFGGGSAACFLRKIFLDLQGKMLFGCRRQSPISFRE